METKNLATLKATSPHPNGAHTSFRRALIDLSAIRHNVHHLKQIAGTSEFIAVVKADGYGHGAERVARAAIDGGATRIGTADLQEALRLKRAGITQVPILAWLHTPEVDFQEAAEEQIELGIWSVGQLEHAAEVASPDRPTVVHIKVETGLARGGAAPESWDELFTRAKQLEADGRIWVIGLFSHLSGTSPEEDLKQLESFEESVHLAKSKGLEPKLLHLAATAATLTIPSTRLNTVRVGVGIYGLSPFWEHSSADLGLRPAMTLQSPVTATRRVGPSHGVSYGYDYRTDKETTLALVPLGYADGIPRQASGRGTVTIKGREYPVVGRVAMDQFIVEVGDDPIYPGDIVTVFGDPIDAAPSADAWALAASTINYEIVTRIGPRVQRIYRES